MDQTAEMKKIVDMNEQEFAKARKELRYYPVPDYLKAMGVTSMTEVTPEMPLVYHRENPFWGEGPWELEPVPEHLNREALSRQLGQITRVKLGYTANPICLLADLFDGKPLFRCVCEGETFYCSRGEIEEEGCLPLTKVDIEALTDPALRAADDETLLSDSVDMKRAVYRLEDQWAVTYFVLVEGDEEHAE